MAKKRKQKTVKKTVRKPSKAELRLTKEELVSLKRIRQALKAKKRSKVKKNPPVIKATLAEQAALAFIETGVFDSELEAYQRTRFMSSRQCHVIIDNPTFNNLRALAKNKRRKNKEGLNPFWYHNIKMTNLAFEVFANLKSELRRKPKRKKRKKPRSQRRNESEST